MQQAEIVEGGLYRGTSKHGENKRLYRRQVVSIFENRVTYDTVPGGFRFEEWLDSFALWARERIDEGIE